MTFPNAIITHVYRLHGYYLNGPPSVRLVAVWLHRPNGFPHSFPTMPCHTIGDRICPNNLNESEAESLMLPSLCDQLRRAGIPKEEIDRALCELRLYLDRHED